MKVQERLLNYVSCHTTSEDDQENIPSTSRQFTLAHMLEKELTDMHLSQVTVDEHCYVYGLLPATQGYESKKRSALFPIWILPRMLRAKM